MSNITTLPNNISYYADQSKKTDGSPILVLNLSQTYIEAIPERLSGVDCIIAREGSIQYIAPDYKGKVIVVESGRPWCRRYLSSDEISRLKICFNRRNSMARGIFEQSYNASEKCRGYPNEEVHLPAGLKFSWNPKTHKGRIDAQKTFVENVGEMANIESVKLAKKEVIQARLERQAKFTAQCAGKNSRRDFALIATKTGNFKRF